MTYQSLPLVTKLEFEGTPLRSIMSPPVPDDVFGCEQIFDTWVAPLMLGDGDSVKDLTELAGSELCEFIALEATGRSLTFQEATVRLLYALGNAKGASMTYGESHIFVSMDGRIFGVQDGKVMSRFCEGLDLGTVNPIETLEGTGDMRTFDSHFCRLYREAYRRGGLLPQALIALHQGNPRFNWRKLAEASRPNQRPSYNKMFQWENMILKKRDPLHVLYLALVPLWMTSAEFSKALVRVSSRPIELSPEQQQNYITQLHTFFHKNNKGFK